LSFDWSAYNSEVYDDLADEAAKDDRVGKQKFMVIDTQDDRWDAKYGGGAFRRVSGILVTARKAKVEILFNEPLSADVVKAEKAGWDQMKVKAVANSRAMVKQLIEHYGVNPSELKPGDSFAVNIVKNKKGFIRIVAILPMDALTQNADIETADSGAPPF